MNDIEKRCIVGNKLKLETRGEGDDKSTVIVGYAALFDKLSEDLGGFREKIAPGAFTNTLKGDPDVRALVDHEPSRIVGRSKSGTLQLAEDKKGLKVEIDPADTQVGRDLVTSMKRGDLDQMSFAFRTNKDEWEYKDNGEPDIRTLIDVELFDVSIVTYPAYPDTTVAVRSHDKAVEDKEAIRKKNAEAREFLDGRKEVLTKE